MDNVDKSRRIVILTENGRYDEYQGELIDVISHKNVYQADLVAIEFSEEPNVFHILKYRGKSRSRIVNREQLNDMIDEMNKLYEDSTFTPREGVCGRLCDTHSSEKFVVYCELLARKKELLNVIAEEKGRINTWYGEISLDNLKQLKKQLNDVERQLKILVENY